MDDSDDINTIFRILDSDGSGFLNREKLQLVCPHLSASEIDIIFNDLDTDHDNRISLKEFTHGFKELIQPNDNQAVLKKQKSIDQGSTNEKDDENLTTNLTQVQINEVFNNLSW